MSKHQLIKKFVSKSLFFKIIDPLVIEQSSTSDLRSTHLSLPNCEWMLGVSFSFGMAVILRQQPPHFGVILVVTYHSFDIEVHTQFPVGLQFPHARL